MLELLFLGTGASVPSRDRATSCIAVRNRSDIILLDCGEGSQRQIMISPFSYMKIRAICITHLHGDHVFGLPGLLQTMSLSGRSEPLTVYGPPGIGRGLEAMMSVTEGETVYPLDVVEVSGGERFQVRDMTVEVYATEHGMASVGYVVRERDRPGKLNKDLAVSLGVTEGPDMARLKAGEVVNGVRPEQVMGPSTPGPAISYSGDTLAIQETAEASENVDVLVHECTYMDSEKDLAADHFHTTTLQAAGIAKSAGAHSLILTHISNRYDDRQAVVDEARTVFGNTCAAEDLDLFEVRHGRVDKRTSD